MKQLNLFMIHLGCKPVAPKRSLFIRWILKTCFNIIETSRNTEQHDTMFAVGSSLKDCKQQILDFWPNAHGLHIDSYAKITHIQNMTILVKPGIKQTYGFGGLELFFVNLGGYTSGVLEEKHKKLLILETEISKIYITAKKNSFFAEHPHIGDVAPHVDDKFGFDDIFYVNDRIPGYHIEIGEYVSHAPQSEVVILGNKKVDDL